MVTLWYAKWLESERGWGQRPDGFLLTIKLEAHHEYLMALREREEKLYGGLVPASYSRPSTGPVLVSVTRLPYRVIKALNERGYYRGYERDLQKQLDNPVETW